MMLTKIVLAILFLAVSINCSPVPDSEDKPSEVELTPVKGFIFQVPGNLCESDGEIFSPKCTEHCKNRGYTNGYCFSSKCTCN